VPSIGRPIDGTVAYVLDREDQPVPAGVTGELYLGGAGLARGYLGRPDLTAERFVPDPFGVGGRLYRTGDLATHRADGVLAYLGRIDHQVKVRGFRIELGEIEAVLVLQPEVREAVVLAADDPAGAPSLIAFLVVALEDIPLDELRSRLEEQLPSHLVPTTFVLLAALPRTPNGKVDRTALLALATDGPERRPSGAEAPRDDLELRLALLWEEVLGVCPIGIAEDFFSLGGHSLLAVRLAGRIRSQLGHDIPLTAFFRGGTVAQMAALLREEVELAAPSPLVPIQTGGSRRPFFCVHPVSGSVFCYAELARQLGPEQPFYGLQSVPHAHCEARAGIESMAARYVEAIREVQPVGPYRLGGWSMGGLVAFEMARQLHGLGEDIELLALLDTAAPDRQLLEGLEDADLAALFVQDLGRLYGYDLQISAAELRGVATSLWPAHLLDKIRTAETLPFEIQPEWLGQRLEAFQANLRAMEQYDPSPYPGRLTLFRTAGQTEIPRSSAIDWVELTIGGFDLRPLPGDHFTFLQPPYIEEWIADLGRCLGDSEGLPFVRKRPMEPRSAE
jgi:thioesterase domain-containing protein